MILAYKTLFFLFLVSAAGAAQTVQLPGNEPSGSFPSAQIIVGHRRLDAFLREREQ
ncbi:MAG: hypothetical protein ACLUEQ_01095 [Cloacibacillus evryensis]